MNLTEDEAKRIAHAIAFGHAYEKHVGDASEAAELLTLSSFESLILETMLNPTRSRELEDFRVAYWLDEEGFLVVFSPNDPDLGTAYWPSRGADEYKKLA